MENAHRHGERRNSIADANERRECETREPCPGAPHKRGGDIDGRERARGSGAKFIGDEVGQEFVGIAELRERSLRIAGLAGGVERVPFEFAFDLVGLGARKCGECAIDFGEVSGEGGAGVGVGEFGPAGHSISPSKLALKTAQRSTPAFSVARPLSVRA